MDSQDDTEMDAVIDAEMEAWIIKQAAEDGIELTDPYGNELEMIKSWQQDPTPEGFEQLYNAHQKLINAASSRYVSGTTLPKMAVKARALQRYTHALQTYNPDRGAAFKTHLYRDMQRLGRYNAQYSNIARVGSEERGGLINLLQSTETSLYDTLGREPTDIELADEMLLASESIADLQKKRDKMTVKNVGTLRKELRKDMTLELAGGEGEGEGTSEIRRKAVFLHGSLNPEQQLVLEHSFEGFGKPIIEDDLELAQKLNLSPQKIRAIKSQIRKKVDKSY